MKLIETLKIPPFPQIIIRQDIITDCVPLSGSSVSYTRQYY
jgi:hypothetical protein